MAHRYFYNGFMTEGIISIETYAGRAEGLDITQLLRLSYTAPQEGRSLEFPIYDEQEGTARIPDYRTQLYWNPNVEVATNETVSFYTGDVPGTYIVDIKGVNSTGEVIQFHSTFIVK